MILSSSSMMFLFSSAGLMLDGEFTLLDETTKVFDGATAAVFPSDGPEGIRSKRRRDRETQHES
jgi:hypothetical protein